ncbi:MAG: HAMP domain-containing sensor histidine kinase [Bacteroidia bacterium]
MKLLHKNILVNASVSLIIMFVGGLITYQLIVDKIKEESYEHLIGEKVSVEQKLKTGTPIPILENNIGDRIQIKEIPNLTGKKPKLKTINSTQTGYEEEESFSAIEFEYAVNQKAYQITIIKMFDNDEELGENILYAEIISAMLMVAAILLANIFIYKRLWSPFYRILRSLETFNISKHDMIKLQLTKTEEFDKLNRSISLMAEKISYDYFSLKEFTENASHEIQTPLAIINSKIEMCLQDEHLTPEQANLLMDASRAVSTLVSLNKGLITLAKLDNNQIDVPSDVNVYEKLLDRLNVYEDFIQEKDIDVGMKIDKTVNIKINPSFSVILFDNLIKNAVKHNYNQGGKINIEVTKEFIKIENTGAKPKVDTDKFFERFYKDSNKESLGLGLAIVKKICEIYGFKIVYNYAADFHSVTLYIS